MAPATIELTILDANGIKNASFFGGKLNPYAVAFVDPGARRSTRVWHKGGAADPIWHDRTEIVVEDQVLFDPSSSLTIQVFNQNFISTALVGETRVMLQDILRQKFRSHSHQGDTVTLQLRRPSGRGQGFIRVFLRLTFDGLHFPTSTDPKDIASSSSSSNAWQGLPFPESDVPATGIPVMITQPYSQSFPLAHDPSSTCMNSFQLPCLPRSQHDSAHDYLHLASYVEGPYSPSCNDSPPQQWMNSFLLGVMTGAVAVALLCVIFTDVVWWRRGG